MIAIFIFRESEHTRLLTAFGMFGSGVLLPTYKAFGRAKVKQVLRKLVVLLASPAERHRWDAGTKAAMPRETHPLGSPSLGGEMRGPTEKSAGGCGRERFVSGGMVRG